MDEEGREVSRGQIGRIAVQGPPKFHGYEGVEVHPLFLPARMSSFQGLPVSSCHSFIAFVRQEDN